MCRPQNGLNCHCIGNKSVEKITIKLKEEDNNNNKLYKAKKSNKLIDVVIVAVEWSFVIFVSCSCIFVYEIQIFLELFFERKIRITHKQISVIAYHVQCVYKCIIPPTVIGTVNVQRM